jgi:Ca2+-binding RTX toxin-like protein
LNTNVDNPTDGNRTFTLTSISDNGGTDNGGHDTTLLSATATVDVDPVNDPAVITDGLHVISNYGSDAFTVPDAAFLAYVSDPDTNLTITNTSDSGLTASHSSSNSWITINDDSSHPGGSLTFTVSGGVESGDVTYQPDTGDLTLNGTNGNDIIVAAAAQHTTVGFANSYDVGDKISVTVNGTTYSYTVDKSSHSSAESVYERLEDSHGHNLADSNAGGVSWADSLTGTSVTLNGDLGDTFTVTSAITNSSGAGHTSQSAPSVATTYDNLTLNGNGGDDYLIGGNGDDTLSGGSGHNVMTGGNGADHFLFGNLLFGDHILDFSGTAGGQGDVIDLLASAFGGGSGAIANADLVQVGTGLDLTATSGPAAVNMGSSHFAYQQSTGQLFYDSDGGSAANRVLVAVFDNHATVQATDIHKV